MPNVGLRIQSPEGEEMHTISGDKSRDTCTQLPDQDLLLKPIKSCLVFFLAHLFKKRSLTMMF